MKINISIDDVSPHEYSGIDVISQCNKILSVFPDAKFTLFIPANEAPPILLILTLSVPS